MNTLRRIAPWLLAILLIGVGMVVIYGKHPTFSATNWDDPDFVMNPPVLKQGLNWDSVRWAFVADLLYESENVEYYIPLTVLTRLMDHTLYGSWAGGHHLTSVLLHWLNACLVLVFLYKATGRYWPALFFACLFAWHPMQVEAASWLAARKDILAATFALLTLIAYLRYARQPSRSAFLLVNVLFLAGLLAKPMLVTLPFVLLLLDCWPLRRWSFAPTQKGSQLPAAPPASSSMIILEKAPMFILVVLASLVTWLSQRDYGAIRSLDRYPLSFRLANAIGDYTAYLGKLFWPRDMSIVYELSPQVESWLGVAISCLLLIAISAVCLWQFRRRPSLTIGWCWFLGTLLPVIGLVQIGDGAMADRYTYLAFLGLYLGIIPVLGELGARANVLPASEPGAPRRKIAATFVVVPAALLLSGAILVARQQAATWRNSITLFQHAVKVSPNSPTAHLLLATSYLEASRLDEAENELNAALQLKPDIFLARYHLGVVAERRGDYAAAATAYQESIRTAPTSPDAILALIRSLLALDRRNEALSVMEYARKNIEVNPESLRQLAAYHLALGQVEQARSLLLHAEDLAPPDAAAINLLAFTHQAQGNAQAAEQNFLRAIKRFPHDPRAYLNLGKQYVQNGRAQDARKILERGIANTEGPNQERLQFTLEALPGSMAPSP